MRHKSVFRLIGILIVQTSILYAGLLCASEMDDVLIKVTLKDTWPPAAVTDLSASATEKEGEVCLSWTAPRHDEAFPGSGAVQGYKIAFDTFSIGSLGGNTTSWWDAARGFYQIDFAHSPGETEALNLYPLTPGVKYYFAIKSYDDASPPNESPIDTRAASVTNQASCVVLDVVPEAPVGLSALAGDTVVDLSWSANTEIDIAGYNVYRYQMPDTRYQIINTGLVTGMEYKDIGLTNEVTYYYVVTAVDNTQHESAYSAEVTAYPQDLTPPAAITDLDATSGVTPNTIILSWTSPGDDGWSGSIVNGQWSIVYSTSRTQAEACGYQDAQVVISTSCSPITGYRLPISGLQGDTTYYFVVRTADEVPNWSEASNIAAAQTLDNVPPRPVSGFTAIAGWGMEIRLSWINPKDADYAETMVRYSTITYPADYADGILLCSGTISTYQHINLDQLVTYYYTAITYDEVPNYSTAVTTSAMSLPVLDATAPSEPWGVRGRLTKNLKHIIISWGRVEKNADGTSCDDLGGYIIYRAAGLGGPWEKYAVVAATSSSWTEPENISDHVFSSPYYYKVRAVDDFFRPNESEDSMIIDSTLKTNIIAISTTTLTHIAMPKDVNQVLYKETNPYKENIKIVVESEPARPEEKRFIAGWEFVALGAKEKKPIEKFEFSKPAVNIVLRYEVVDGRIGRNGCPAKTSSPEISNIPADKSAQQLAIFWHNGIEWVKLGGTVDPDYQTISLKSKYLGKYEIRHCLRAMKFTLTQIDPTKIFTPNDDGDNDIITFHFENPELNKDVFGKIYDLTGAVVATLEEGYIPRETLQWDGKIQDSDRVAPSGVYIYQIECGKAVANGTVVLAK